MLVGVASLPHSRPPEYRRFTVETGKTAYTFATQYTKTADLSVKSISKLKWTWLCLCSMLKC